MVNIKTRYTFVYRSRDGHYMRPESFLNINKGRTLSSSQLRALGITKVKLKESLRNFRLYDLKIIAYMGLLIYWSAMLTATFLQ